MSQLCKVHSNIYVYVQAEKVCISSSLMSAKTGRLTPSPHFLKLELCWNGMEYIRRSLRLYEAHLEKSRSTEENKSIRLRIGEALCLLAGYMCTTSSRVSIDEKVDIERRSLYTPSLLSIKLCSLTFFLCKESFWRERLRYSKGLAS